MKIGYIRVSTKEQNTIRQEILMQDLGVDKIYIEKISGKNTNRPILKEMLEFVREGDFLIVESISRFARNTKDLLELIDLLDKKGVNFISKKETIDTTTPSGKFMLTVFGAVSELERAYILDRQKEGIEAMPTNEEGKKVSTKTGRATGRPTATKPTNFNIVADRVIKKEITSIQAMKELELTKNVYYKFFNDYKTQQGLL